MRTNALERLYDIAEQQGGHFTAHQAAKEGGVSRQMLWQLTERGHLERVRNGIYRLKRFPTVQHEDLIVALLAVGLEAAISPSRPSSSMGSQTPCLCEST